jgi:threonine dehydrogenase-like Zn-dependent dehydrogenase
LVAPAEGTLAWCESPPVAVPGTLDSDTAAILALLSVAQAVVAAVEHVLPNAIEIAGHGLIARQLRELLEAPSAKGGRSTRLEQPDAIVDTTGDPRIVVDATRRVAELGTVVLVGESLGRRAEMNLYPDVHVRGLTLVGIAPPLKRAEALFAQTDADDPLVASCRDALVHVDAGTPLPPGATWYRISG